MKKTNRQSVKFMVARFFFAAGLSLAAAAQSHKPLPPLAPATNPHRTRLILKDGSYQIVMSYRIVGSVVHYVSAERGGAEEEIPAALVDFDATHRWEWLRPVRTAPTRYSRGTTAPAWLER